MINNEILYFNCSGRQNIQTGNYGLTCKKINRRPNPQVVQGVPVLGQQIPVVYARPVSQQLQVPVVQGRIPVVQGRIPVVQGRIPVVQGTVPVVHARPVNQQLQVRAATQMPLFSLLFGSRGGNSNNKKSRKITKRIKTIKRRKNRRRKTRK